MSLCLFAFFFGFFHLVLSVNIFLSIMLALPRIQEINESIVLTYSWQGIDTNWWPVHAWFHIGYAFVAKSLKDHTSLSDLALTAVRFISYGGGFKHIDAVEKRSFGVRIIVISMQEWSVWDADFHVASKDRCLTYQRILLLLHHFSVCIEFFLIAYPLTFKHGVLWLSSDLVHVCVDPRMSQSFLGCDSLIRVFSNHLYNQVAGLIRNTIPKIAAKLKLALCILFQNLVLETSFE